MVTYWHGYWLKNSVYSMDDFVILYLGIYFYTILYVICLLVTYSKMITVFWCDIVVTGKW